MPLRFRKNREDVRSIGFALIINRGVRRLEVWKCSRLLIMIRPLRTWDSSLRAEWQTRGGWMSLSFIVILNELLGEEESQLWECGIKVWKCYWLLFMIRPLRTWDSSLRAEWQGRVIRFIRVRDSSLRSEWQAGVFLLFLTSFWK